MRVLLIEDDPMIGKSLKQALQNESMRVDWTRSGVEERKHSRRTTTRRCCSTSICLTGTIARRHGLSLTLRKRAGGGILATVSGPAVTSGTKAPCSSERPAPSSGPTSRRAAEASNTHLPGPA